MVCSMINFFFLQFLFDQDLFDKTNKRVQKKCANPRANFKTFLQQAPQKLPGLDPMFIPIA